MSDSQSDIAAGYAVLQQEIEPLLFLVRNSDLQRDAISKAQKFLNRVERARIGAIAEANEVEANSYLGLGAAIAAMMSEMEVYLLIKQDQPEAAWGKLIEAQEGVRAAARASKALTNLDRKFEFLRELETALFPPQIFASAGLIVHEQMCSICQADYEACNHIAGRAYMGRFCSLVIKKATADHVSIVDDPADRRCRVISVGVTNGKRNRMTWVVTPDPAPILDSGDSSGERNTTPLA